MALTQCFSLNWRSKYVRKLFRKPRRLATSLISFRCNLNQQSVLFWAFGYAVCANGSCMSNLFGQWKYTDPYNKHTHIQLCRYIVLLNIFEMPSLENSTSRTFYVQMFYRICINGMSLHVKIINPSSLCVYVYSKYLIKCRARNGSLMSPFLKCFHFAETAKFSKSLNCEL